MRSSTTVSALAPSASTKSRSMPRRFTLTSGSWRQDWMDARWERATSRPPGALAMAVIALSAM